MHSEVARSQCFLLLSSQGSSVLLNYFPTFRVLVNLRPIKRFKSGFLVILGGCGC
jgi:hypothetical protein